MVFLRPTIMRDAESANRISLDRYELLRGQQKDAQPPPSMLVPINESPVLPPQRAIEQTTVPLNPPPLPEKKPAN
jgi:general secretion pathway protein D